jgi:hypothetical protein
LLENNGKRHRVTCICRVSHSSFADERFRREGENILKYRHPTLLAAALIVAASPLTQAQQNQPQQAPTQQQTQQQSQTQQQLPPCTATQPAVLVRAETRTKNRVWGFVKGEIQKGAGKIPKEGQGIYDPNDLPLPGDKGKPKQDCSKTNASSAPANTHQ